MSIELSASFPLVFVALAFFGLGFLLGRITAIDRDIERQFEMMDEMSKRKGGSK